MVLVNAIGGAALPPRSRTRKRTHDLVTRSELMMRANRVLPVTAALLFVAACTSDRPAPTGVEIRTPLFARSAATNLNTHLDGADENPPNASLAQGEAIFRVSDDGTSVHYTLIASNIDNAFMAHIHLAPAGVNGPIVEWLFPSTAPVQGPLGSGRHDGVLAEGHFTAADLVGPLKGHPLAELIAAMRSGGAYVNVHTNDGVAPVTNTPGDLPGGEIRGQVHAPGSN
jgi:hypothetical protein